MTDPEMTMREAARRFTSLEAHLDRLTVAVETMTTKLNADFYHIADNSRRVDRLEKLTYGLLGGAILAVVGVVVDGVITLAVG